MLSITLNFQNETKNCSNLKSFDELIRTITQEFNINSKIINDFNICYRDDDGDSVQIANEYDFAQAVIYMQKQGLKNLEILIEEPKEVNQKILDSNYVLISQNTN